FGLSSAKNAAGAAVGFERYLYGVCFEVVGTDLIGNGSECYGCKARLIDCKREICLQASLYFLVQNRCQKAEVSNVCFGPGSDDALAVDQQIQFTLTPGQF